MYHKIDVARKNGYSFVVECDHDDEELVIAKAKECGLFQDPEDAHYAVCDDLVSDCDIQHFKECNAILTLPNEGTVTEETMCYDHPPVLTCVEDLCQMVGCDIKHELTASLKVEGMLNYLQEQGVIETYNADRLDYVFGNDKPY